MAPRDERPGPAGLSLATQLVAAAALTLWSVDALVNLGLFGRLFVGEPLPGRVRDFTAMLLAETPAALALGLGAWLGGWILGRRRDARRQAAALAAGGVPAFVLLAELRLSGNVPDPLRPVAYAAAVVAGLGLWWGARRRLAAAPPPGAGRCLGLMLAPALCLAFANGAVAAVGAPAPAAAVQAIAAALLLAAALGEWRGPGRWTRGARAATVAATVALVALSIGEDRRPVPAGRSPVTPPPAGERPTMVLVVLDTVRADHLPIHGYRRPTMPRLERWGEDAAVFARAVAAGGWTTPSHASILSGRTVSDHGIHYARRLGERLHTPPLPGVRWLPAELARLGYRCLAVSANPLALPAEIDGFDHRVEPVRFPWERGTIGALLDRHLPARLGERLRWRMPYVDAEGIARRAVGALEGDGPLFLFVNFLDAHSPYNPPLAALDGIRAAPGHALDRYLQHRVLTRRWEQLGPGARDDLVDLYDGELRFLDGELARLLTAVEERFPEALVVVTSDHGEELGEEGRVGHEHGVPQSVVHVPLLVRAPWVAPERVEELVSQRRLYPFLLAAARGERPAARSLVDGGGSGDDGLGVLVERYPTEVNREPVGPGALRPWVALFDGDLKGIGPSGSRFELHRLTGGFGRPGETLDPALGADLRRRIDDYWHEHRDRRDTDGEPSAEKLRELRALGYVE